MIDRKEFTGVYKKLEMLRGKYEPTSDAAIFLGMVRDMARYVSKENWGSVKAIAADIPSQLEKDRELMSSDMKVAQRLLVMAKTLAAEEEDVEELDENFVKKLRTLKGSLSSISQKKRKKLGQLGIGALRQNATVEDLVDALLTAARS